jgi:hypothetical protein
MRIPQRGSCVLSYGETPSHSKPFDLKIIQYYEFKKGEERGNLIAFGNHYKQELVVPPKRRVKVGFLDVFEEEYISFTFFFCRMDTLLEAGSK